jgi:hypothetical protein
MKAGYGIRRNEDEWSVASEARIPETIVTGPRASPALLGVEIYELAGVDAWAVSEQGMACDFADETRAQQHGVGPIIQPRRANQDRVTWSTAKLKIIEVVQYVVQVVLKIKEVTEWSFDRHCTLRDLSIRP